MQPVVNETNAQRLSRMSLDSGDIALMAAPTGAPQRYTLPSKLEKVEIRKAGWLLKLSGDSDSSMFCCGV